jgi:predicted nucleic-acid-binding protein
VIGLDTNVLVRYIVRDDPRQAAIATRIVESMCRKNDPGIVPAIVLCELVWVLNRGYGYGRADIVKVLRFILGADDLHVESSDLVWQALNTYEREKADFSDYLIGLMNRHLKAEVTYTFDRLTAGNALFHVLDDVSIRG